MAFGKGEFKSNIFSTKKNAEHFISTQPYCILKPFVFHIFHCLKMSTNKTEAHLKNKAYINWSIINCMLILHSNLIFCLFLTEGSYLEGYSCSVLSYGYIIILFIIFKEPLLSKNKCFVDSLCAIALFI